MSDGAGFRKFQRVRHVRTGRIGRITDLREWSKFPGEVEVQWEGEYNWWRPGNDNSGLPFTSNAQVKNLEPYPKE